jgi:hypothetical protein
MNPNFLNLFMKKLTRERVVPIISARVATCHFCQLSMLAVSKRIGGTGGSASMFEQPMFERSVSRGKPALAAPARGCGLGTLVGADSF